MNKCENCELSHNGKYGSGRFCSIKCARGFSTKENRKEINKKVSEKLTLNRKGICILCNNEFIMKKKKQKFCSKKCSNKIKSEETLIKMSINSKKQCSTLEGKLRMKEIGRMGGFGKKGYTNNGHYYQSTLEKNCFEYLYLTNIKFDIHKNLPNDARETDIFLIEHDIWIELDGIDREKRKEYLGHNYNKWREKINRYKELNLKLVILYSFDEFKEYIDNLSSNPIGTTNM